MAVTDRKGPKNSTTTSRGRTYRWRDEEFDSVTTLINGGVPKPALKAWGERRVAETAVAKQTIWRDMTADEAVDWLKRAPFRETDKAAAKGSDVHAWAEAHVLGRPQPEPDEAVAPYAEQFARFLAAFQPVFEATEATVYNRQYHYAGTLDAIVTIGDHRWLCDWKTGKGVYGEVALQLAAYRHAEFVGTPDNQEAPMPEVDGCAVLHLRPDSFELIPVEAGPAEFRAFLYAREIARFVKERSREVLLAPLQPDSLEAALGASLEEAR